jgi:uncharacterized phiE125 gp8 family phage protein
MGLRLTTQSTTTVLATSDVKTHLNIDINDDDPMLVECVKDAERYVEDYTQRQLLTATWTLTLDCFPEYEIKLPRPPLQSITSIAYVNDSDGTNSTLSTTAYRVSTNGLLGRITPNYNDTWPTPRAVTDAVTITFVAGATAVADVPREAIRAAKLLVAHYYANRTAVIATGAVPQINQLGVSALLGNISVGDYA